MLKKLFALWILVLAAFSCCILVRLKLRTESRAIVRYTSHYLIPTNFSRRENALHHGMITNSTVITDGHTSLVNCPIHNRSRYIIQWFNWEQLTMATNNLVTLAWFTAPWRANVVEPFTKNSKYFGVPFPQAKKHSFFSIFRKDEFNQLLCKHGIPPLLSYSNFLSNSNKQVILIHLLYDGFDLPRFNKLKLSRKKLTALLRKKGGRIADCSQIKYINKIGSMLLKNINQFNLLGSSRPPFKIHHYCCINASHPTYSWEVAKECHIPENEDVTVVFTDWKGVSPQKGFRVFAPESKGVDLPNPSRDVYPYSQSIIRNASAFLYSITGGSEFIGVHLRTEKLGEVNAKVNGYFDFCLNSTHSTISRILAGQNSTLKVLYIADIGPFGSSSCKRNCLSRKLIGATFDKYGIEITHYYPENFGGITDSGFVATVEQEALSKAKMLLLVGSGSFQSQLIARYRHSRQNQLHPFHIICDVQAIKKT